MSVKATALVTETVAGTNSGTFAVTIRSVNVATGSVANIALDNVSPNVASLAFQQSIIEAVKDYWSLGVLDSVRLIGSDIL